MSNLHVYMIHIECSGRFVCFFYPKVSAKIDNASFQGMFLTSIVLLIRISRCIHIHKCTFNLFLRSPSDEMQGWNYLLFSKYFQ